MSKAGRRSTTSPSRRCYKDKEETYAVRNAMGTGPYTLKQAIPT